MQQPRFKILFSALRIRAGGSSPSRSPEIFEAQKRLAQPYFEIIWNILKLYETLAKLDLL
jgi:hypothetical protein